ncbi:THxN family PEP-CTERM protein [Thalassotalea sediminis]|uniref:THxN family PEP-CTERM protein n=1 Tax=Thalassotalea sediminis TaxID=1759089 RepID=UPI0025742D1D|nr:THxN family PEP-CTERM protein [Thalassotalea sediminis]
MKTKLKVCATILAATLSASATAGIVTQWTYDNQAGFKSWNGTNNNGWASDDVTASGDSAGIYDNILDTDLDNDVDGDDSSLPTNLAWGTPANGAGNPQSSLDIDSPINDTVSTNDWNWADGTSITHENWVIVGDALTDAFVLDGLTLTPTDWEGKGNDAAADALLTDNAPYFAPQLQFGINFFETPNGGTYNGSGFDCPNGELRDQGDNINGCGDIFEITGLENLPIQPIVGADFIEFTVPFVLMANGVPLEGWGDTTYYLTTRLSGLTTLSDDYECSNNQPACFGFVTVEEQQNNLLAQLKVRTVPEPATIAIFGLGLVATGLVGRRRRNV